MLKLALLPYAYTQSPDISDYLPVDIPQAECLCLAVYNHVKKLTLGECDLCWEYMQDLRFVHR